MYKFTGDSVVAMYHVFMCLCLSMQELEHIRGDSRKQLSEKLLERRRRSPGYHLTPGATRTPKEERSQKTEVKRVGTVSFSECPTA